jgi:hypothetical protein
MSSIINRVTDTISPNLHLDFLNQGAHAIEEQAEHAVDFSVSLAEGYASRVGTDLLSPNLLHLISSRIAPAVQPDTAYDGAFVGAGGRTFPPTTPLNQIPAVRPSNGRQPAETLIYVNGINTNRAGQSASLQAIANQTGAQVIGIHNATEGMIRDLEQCVTDKLDQGNNPAVDTLANTVYNEIKAGRSVHLLAHSQGGLIVSRALNDVSERLQREDGLSRAAAERMLGRVKVETFGGAAGHYPNGPQYVHYVNRDDPVPSLFGLGWDMDRLNPTLNAGRGAVIHWFTDVHLNPIASHSFEDVYLPRRVPFDQARQGRF